MNAIAENIIALRKQKNFSQDALAKEFGIKRARLSSYEQGAAFPPIDILKKYAAFFNVDITSIIYAKGEIPAPQATAETKAIEEAPLRVLAITVDEDDNENIEFVPVKAAAGYTTEYANPEFIRTLPKFRLPFLAKGTYRAFEINGDSMLPIISGSVIIGQYVESFKDVKKDETYIFITLNNGLLFKRVADINKQNIYLKSDNPLFESYSLPLCEIQEIWKSKLFMSKDFRKPEDDNILDRIEKSISNLQQEVKEIKGREN
jgi:transcriptional regulator with XRE-family HTH domain